MVPVRALASIALLLVSSGCGDDSGSGAAPTSGGGGTSSSGPSSGGFGGGGGAECACIEHATCDAQGACACDEGWKGDGSICVDLDECFEHSDNCADSAECKNLDGTFECACPAGTVGDPEDACTTLYDRVTSRSGHTCAMRSDGALYCFGAGGSGRLGNGLTAHQPAPVLVGAADNWSAVEAGGAHTCGIKETGTLWCWGSNAFGQLGLGHLDAQTLPAWIDLTRTFTSVAVGESHGCAVESTGELYCFGRNNAGQLGDGTPRTAQSSSLCRCRSTRIPPRTIGTSCLPIGTIPAL